MAASRDVRYTSWDKASRAHSTASCPDNGASKGAKDADFTEEDHNELERCAYEEAMSNIKNMLTTSDQLAKVPYYLRELSDKYEDAVMKLSAAVENQLDETRIGCEILDLCVGNIEGIKNDFSDINASCIETNRLLDPWSVPSFVNNAKTNVEYTATQRKALQEIPYMVDKLESLLDEAPNNIKDVYIKLRALVKLRDSAAASANSNSKSSIKAQEKSINKKSTDKIQNLLLKRVWENITDALFLCDDEPAVLLQTVEIIRIEDVAIQKVFPGPPAEFKAVPRSDVFGPKNGMMVTDEERETEEKYGYMTAQMFETLQKSISDQFIDLYLSFEEAQEEGKKKEAKEAPRKETSETQQKENGPQALPRRKVTQDGYLSEVFETLKEHMLDLECIKDLIGPLFPAKFAIGQFVEAAYCKHLTAIVNRQLSDHLSLTASQALMAVKFLQWSVDQLTTLESIVKLKSQYENLITALMNHFVKLSQANVTKLLSNAVALDRKTPATHDQQGHYYTLLPGEFFGILDIELSLVFDEAGIGGVNVYPEVKALLDFVVKCQSMISQFLHQVTFEGDAVLLGEDKIAHNDAYICAAINNCEQSEHLLDDVRNRCLDALNNTPDSVPDKIREAIEVEFENCSGGYLDLSIQAISLLVRKLLSDLKPDWNGMFSKGPWMEGEASSDLIESAIGLLAKYDGWINHQKHFCLFVRELTLHFVETYIRRLIDKKLSNTAADHERLAADAELFKDNFVQVVDDRPTRTVIEAHMAVLGSVVAILQEQADFINLHFLNIVKVFGPQSLSILQNILATRSDLNKAERKRIVDACGQEEQYKRNVQTGPGDRGATPVEDTRKRADVGPDVVTGADALPGRSAVSGPEFASRVMHRFKNFRQHSRNIKLFPNINNINKSLASNDL